ncbi:MAG: hypothetical protein WCR33_05345, partial [Bacilli bacterium]
KGNRKVAYAKKDVLQMKIYEKYGPSSMEDSSFEDENIMYDSPSPKTNKSKFKAHRQTDRINKSSSAQKEKADDESDDGGEQLSESNIAPGKESAEAIKEAQAEGNELDDRIRDDIPR